MKLLSIQVGKPKTVGVAGAANPMDREWTTAFFKEPVSGPVYAGELGLDGDGQGDMSVHGGPDKAINIYPQDHHAYWLKDLGIEMPHGAFGENFTTQGMTEDEVCIGDIFRMGPVLLQVTQPREPCWKLARRWRVKDLALRVQTTGKTGWYFRVLEEGIVEAPSEFEFVKCLYPHWTITEANQIMHHRKTNWQAAHELAECPELAQTWKTALSLRATTKTVASSEARLGGNDI
jgi:MOSC domain-containing protein YiiM